MKTITISTPKIFVCLQGTSKNSLYSSLLEKGEGLRPRKKIVFRGFLQLISLLAVSVVLMTTASCKDDPTAEEIFRKKIALSWKSSSTGVQFNGKDVNAIFNGFTLTFTESQTYNTTTGNAPVWPTSGKFTTVASSSAAGFDLKREDGVIVQITQLTETKLVLKFSYTGKSNRVSSVSGGYVFDLVKK